MTDDEILTTFMQRQTRGDITMRVTVNRDEILSFAREIERRTIERCTATVEATDSPSRAWLAERIRALAAAS